MVNCGSGLGLVRREATAGQHLGGELADCPFLNLPREVRNLVYRELVKGLAVSPPSFSDVVEDSRTKTKDFMFPHDIMCAPFPPHISSAPSLLLVNKQVHREVQEFLSYSRLEIRPLTYKLDCIVTRGGLYPTWLSVPALSSNVDVVEANLRFSGDVIIPTWLRGDRGPGYMMWTQLPLLNRFLSRGADLLSEPPSLATTGTRIGVLVLNVVKSADEDLSTRWGVEDVQRTFEKIAFWIGRLVQTLLHIGGGQMMREKVGLIRLCVDGQERSTFDVRRREVEHKVTAKSS